MASKYKFHAIRRKNGLYQANYWINLPDGSKKREAVYDRDKKELRKKWEKAVALNITGEVINKSNLTVATYLTNWLETSPNLKILTKRGYQSNINCHIIPRIGNIKLSSLTTIRVQQMINDIMKSGNSARTAQLVKAIMSSALKQAEAQKLIQPNIMKYIQIPKHEPKVREIWDKENADKFMQAIKGERYRFFYEMYLTYGLRRGEAIALKWEDIDFNEKVIHIRRECINLKGGPIIDTLKTKTSKRDLPMLPHIEALLKSLPYNDAESFIISNDNEPINPDSVSRRFKVIIKNAGLPNVVLHSLRHFAATTLKEAGVNIKDTQEIMGHSTPITTLKYYQHAHMEAKREAMLKYMNYVGFSQN